MAGIIFLVIASFVLCAGQFVFDPDLIVFPDDTNQLGSKCIRQSDGILGICTKILDCRGFPKTSVADFCDFAAQTVCCSLDNINTAEVAQPKVKNLNVTQPKGLNVTQPEVQNVTQPGVPKKV